MLQYVARPGQECKSGLIVSVKRRIIEDPFERYRVAFSIFMWSISNNPCNPKFITNPSGYSEVSIMGLRHYRGYSKVWTAVQNSDLQKVSSGPPRTTSHCQQSEPGILWKFSKVDPGTKNVST